MANIKKIKLVDNTEYDIVDASATHIQTVTLAQWNALTPEQQASGDYVVTGITTSPLSANLIPYDNTLSGLAATTAQGAIDEVKSDIPANSDFTLSDLSDTTITTPTANQVLSYDGSKWVNDDIIKNKIGQSYIVCILAGAGESGFRIQFPSNSRFTILVQDINGRVTSITKKTASNAVITDISGSYLATAVDSTNVYLRSGEWDIATFIISSFDNVENITVISYT